MLPNPKNIEDLKILVVDDSEANVVFLTMALEAAGFKNVSTANNGFMAVDFCASQVTDLVLLDLHMPHMDGFETLKALRPYRRDFLPVLVFTADVSMEARRRALELGANDFLTKPGDILEIGLRVRNFLEMRRLHLETIGQRDLLEEKVQERTKELHEAHVDVLARLALAGEFRDDETGEHTKRVSDLSGRLAEAAGLDVEATSLIRYAALLHDLGKIGIPDSILRKKGALCSDEREFMKGHTEIGGRILANSRSPFLKVAYEIALSHHEHWNGQGYPRQICGEQIPLSGRIVAIADAFDAMSSKRVYHEGVPARTALAELVRCAGTQFDPHLVSLFVTLMSEELSKQVLSQAA